MAKRMPTESFYTIALDIQNRVLGIEEVSRGTASGVDVHPRDVFQGAIVANAVAVVVAHNHSSSGDPEPSADDFALTRRLNKVGKLVGIPVLDHVVVGDRRCVSIREHAGALFSDEDDDLD
jgi:DNA repair protein RadC